MTDKIAQLEIDTVEAARHIALIEPSPMAVDPMERRMGLFAVDDSKERDDPELTRFAYMSLLDLITEFDEEDAETGRKKLSFSTLQKRGAGLFNTVNEVNGYGRKTVNIIQFRAVFCEHDNEAKEPLAAILARFPLPPSLVIESSPGRYHFHWFPSEGWLRTPELERLWRGVQARIVREYGGDKRACDPARVLRLAGSWHQKHATPWLVRIVDASDERYTVEEIAKAFPPVERSPKSPDAAWIDAPTGADYAEKQQRLLEHAKHALAATASTDYKVWIDIGQALRFTFGDGAFELWDKWSENAGAKYCGHDFAWAKWTTFADQGQERVSGNLGVGTLFYHAKRHGWTPPAPTLQELGFDGIKPAPATPQAPEPPAAEIIPESLDEDAAMARMNKRYAFIEDRGGRSLILDETVDANGNAVMKYRNLMDFEKAESNWHVITGDVKGKAVLKPVGKFWRESPKRRTFRGVTFDPAGAPLINGYLNTWRGLAIEPKAGSWKLMRAHIDNVLAAETKEHAAYITHWIAWAVQNPGKVAEVALVFRSGEGTGKGFLGRALHRIFGQHGLHVTRTDLLTGRFNGHLENVCFVFADEAVWGGDKAAQGALYGLVTEPTQTIEHKGLKPYSAPSALKIMIASNHDWVVPAGGDARRWAMFNVAETQKGKRGYFAALQRELDDGGLGAMLHELQGLDLKGWHPRNEVPHTEALQEQKELALSPPDAWLLHLLETGDLPRRTWSGAANSATSNDLYEHLKLSAEGWRGVDFRTVAGILKKWGCEPKRSESVRYWEFPDLGVIRAQWCKKFGKKCWENPGGNWQGKQNWQIRSVDNIIALVK